MHGETIEHGGKLRARDSAVAVDESVAVAVHDPGGLRPNSGIRVLRSRGVGKRGGLDHNRRAFPLIERKDYVASFHRRVPAVHRVSRHDQSKQEQKRRHLFVNTHKIIHLSISISPVRYLFSKPRLFRPVRGGKYEIHDVFLYFPPPSAGGKQSLRNSYPVRMRRVHK